MCGFANPLSFKKITDTEIMIVETFIRTKTMDFLQQRQSDNIDRQCDAFFDDEELIDHFGELYANNPTLFEFHEGHKIFIREIVDHVKRIVDGNGINTGLGFFQNVRRYRKRAASRASKLTENQNYKLVKLSVKPVEGNNLKFELIRKVAACFEPYMTDARLEGESMNIDECIVVVQNEDGSKIYGDVSCIICKVENRKNQKPKRVYYNIKSESKGCWVLSNIIKHLQHSHTPNTNTETDEQLQLDPPQVTDDSDAQQLDNLCEEHYIVEKDSNDNLSLILVDDSDLQKIENSDQDNPDLVYTQLSTQITDVLSSALKYGEPRAEITYVLAKAPRKLAVVCIPGDGNCLFSALAHQLWMHKIKSKGHKQSTKELRAEVVEHILNPEHFAMYEHRLRDRVYNLSEKSGEKINDLEKECKFFVRHILSKPRTWGGAETLLAVSVLYSTNVFVFNENGSCTKIKKAGQNNNRSIAVAFRIGLNEQGEEIHNHYDSVCEIGSSELYNVVRKNCK